MTNDWPAQSVVVWTPSWLRSGRHLTACTLELRHRPEAVDASGTTTGAPRSLRIRFPRFTPEWPPDALKNVQLFTRFALAEISGYRPPSSRCGITGMTVPARFRIRAARGWEHPLCRAGSGSQSI